MRAHRPQSSQNTKLCSGTMDKSIGCAILQIACGRAAQRCSAAFSRRSFASSCSLSNSRINLCHKPSADTRPRVGFSASRQGRCTGNHKNRVLERVTRKEQRGEKNLSIITRTSAYAEHDGRCVRPRHFQSRSLYTRPQQRFSCVPGWTQDRYFTRKISGLAGKAGCGKFSHLGLAISLSL